MNIGPETITVHGFNTALLSIDRTSRQKSQQEISELDVTTEQMDFTDIHRLFHPTAIKHTFFSAVPRMLSKIDHILGHKEILDRRKLIVSCSLSDHNEEKIGINNKGSYRNDTNTQRLNNTLLNEQ
jgi:hypothetical protein